MSKLSKPLAFSVMPRPLPRPARAVFWQASPRQASPLVLACVLLVVLIVTATGALVAFASPILIGSAGSLPDAASRSIRSE